MKPSEGRGTGRLRLGILAVLLSLAGNAAAAWPVLATGANVDESRVQQTFYVDPAHTEAADDDKHGAADLPFATLNYACQIAAKAKDANVGVKIVLAAGTYREAATVPAPPGGKPDTDALLVIEAAEREQAVVDGADTEGWSPSTWKVEGTRWTHPWPFRRNAPARPAAGIPANATGESSRRGDLVFINGTLLRQVNQAADLAPGCFWAMLPVNPSGRRGSAAAGGGQTGTVAVVVPPPETELPGAIIQVGVRPRGLTISGRRNVVVRGLLIQHAAQPDGAGENTAGLWLDRCSNVLVEDVLSQWNDGVGLEILGHGEGAASADFTLRRVRLLHNGGSGLTASSLKNLLAEDCETSFNNFRGDWAGWIDPAGSAGVRLGGVPGVSVSTWRRQQIVGNACHGLWSVEGGTDLTVENSVVRDNGVTGMCIENHHGPVWVKRCVIDGTKNGPGGQNGGAVGAGLSLKSTPDVTLESNVFANNAATQLGIGVGAGKSPLQTERHVYRHNVFYSKDADSSLYRMPDLLHVGSLASYYLTLDSQENCFWNPDKLEMFEGYFYLPVAHAPSVLSKSQASNLEGWQADVQRQVAATDAKARPKIEEGSRWQDPLFVDPAAGDYRVKKASPVAEWDLPSDEAAGGQ